MSDPCYYRDDAGGVYTGDQVVYRVFDSTLTKFEGNVTKASADESDNPKGWIVVKEITEEEYSAVYNGTHHVEIEKPTAKRKTPKLFTDGKRIYWEKDVVLDGTSYVTKSSYERSDNADDWHRVVECVRMRLPPPKETPTWTPRMEEIAGEPFCYLVESESRKVPEGHDWRECAVRVECVANQINVDGHVVFNAGCSCEGMDYQLHKHIKDGHIARCKHIRYIIPVAYEKLIVFWARKHFETIENKTTSLRMPFQKNPPPIHT